MATTTVVPKNRISGGSFLLESRRTDEVFTPEDFTEQQQLIGQTAEDFTINEILPNVEKMEHKDFSISRDLLKKAGDLGLSGVEIPEAYGGLEMDKVTAGLFRHRGAEEEISAALGCRRNRGRIRVVGSFFRIRRIELPGSSPTHGRWHALHSEWREDVDH